MIHINGGWKINFFDNEDGNNPYIASFDYNDSGWLEAYVPGDVHTILKKAGIINDPFYAHNDMDCCWVPEKTWWYRGKFEFEQSIGINQRVELVFEGLDTYAEIYLNGDKIGEHNNMFIPVSFDITNKIIKGTNLIAVRFSPVSEDTKKRDFGDMWLLMNKDRVFTRKSSMNFGWDWGPAIPTIGIWKDVFLKVYNKAKLSDLFVKTLKITPAYAEVEIDVDVHDFSRGSLLSINISIENRGYSFSRNIPVMGGRVKNVFKIPEPKLWWTHDLGNPDLYDLTIELLADGTVVDSKRDSFGIRTIELKQKDEAGNNRFTFVLNNVEIFAKGANWIPSDNMIGSIEDSRYIELISMAKEANMNMIRVWGGGIYEKDIFYNECDRQGILVWQDFMFACSSYPDYDREFMENVRNEIISIVKRLRNHPSIALWCGNNECQWIHAQKLCELKDIRFYGEKIYHELIPSIMKELDDTRAYWPGSPYGGDDPNSDEEGDKHNWQVWAGMVYPHKSGETQQTDLSPDGVSFKNYAKDMGKFISEFGMHAAPIKETLRRNIPEEELYLGSFEMDYRNKDITPVRGIMLMESYTGQPKNLDQYIDFSMLCQSEGLKFGVEHYRRRKPDCSGALIWQLNDCWPGTSWSIIDYYLIPKAAYYYAKRFFSPILLSFKEEDSDNVSLWITNDTLEEYKDTLTVGVQNFFGKKIFEEEIEVHVMPNTSKLIKRYSLTGPEIIMFQRRWNFMYVKGRKQDICRNEYFFVDYKDIRLPKPRFNIDIAEKGNRLEIVIETDCFARFVKVECPVDGTVMSDNYFNLLPGESKRITVTNRKGNSLTKNDVSISSLHC